MDATERSGLCDQLKLLDDKTLALLKRCSDDLKRTLSMAQEVCATTGGTGSDGEHGGTTAKPQGATKRTHAYTHARVYTHTSRVHTLITAHDRPAVHIHHPKTRSLNPTATLCGSGKPSDGTPEDKPSTGPCEKAATQVRAFGKASAFNVRDTHIVLASALQRIGLH